MEVLPQERRTIGSFIYRHPESSATDLSSGQMENRKTDKNSWTYASKKNSHQSTLGGVNLPKWADHPKLMRGPLVDGCKIWSEKKKQHHKVCIIMIHRLHR